MIHWTNGGCHELFVGWSLSAEALGFDALSHALKARTNLGFGFSATGIDHEFLCDELSSNIFKSQWLETMDYFIGEIKMKGPIPTSLDVNWDDELQNIWIGKLNKMRHALELQVCA